MSLHLITAPARLPLTLQEAKAELRIFDDDSQDALIDQYIDEATDYLDSIDGVLGRCLVQQVVEFRTCEFACAIELPLAPWVSTVSVKYLDQTEVETTLASDQYTTSPGSLGLGILRPAYGVSWPSPCDRSDAVRIQYLAGYAAEDNGGLSGKIPAGIIGGLLELVKARIDGCGSCEDYGLPGKCRRFVVHSF